MNPTRLTAEQDKFVRRNAKIMTADQMAEKLGFEDRRIIYRAARRLGVSLRKHGDNHPFVRYPDALVERARQLRDDGWLVHDIAKETGIKYGTLRLFLDYSRRAVPASTSSEGRV